MADIDLITRERGEAETAMHRLSREMPGDETLAFALLGRMVDELAARIDHLEAELPHSEPPRQEPPQVLELWAERGFYPDSEGRLRERAEDNAIVDLR